MPRCPVLAVLAARGQNRSRCSGGFIHGLLALSLLAALAAPAPARAMQFGISVGARAGTLGIGADVAVPVGRQVAIRGGAGLLGLDLDMTGRFGLADHRTAELSLPKALYTIGAEVSFLGLRAGAGILIKSGDPTYRIDLDQGASIDIGGNTYTEPAVGTLTTTYAWSSGAPYLTVGLGSLTGAGFGFLIDVGAVLLEDSSFSMTATGDQTLIASSQFLDDLRTEEREVRDDAGGWAGFWPIVSIGFRLGLPGGV